MTSVRVLTALGLLAIVGAASRAEETTTSKLTTTEAPATTIGQGQNEKIARRIIDDKLTPPKVTEFAPWRRPLGEVQRVNGPPRVTEEVEENATDKAVPKKTRTVGPTQEPSGSCCGPANGAGSGPHIFPDEKDKGSEALDLERGAGPAPRFHGNRPTDDRYGHSGWRSSSYLGYGKDKGYYDQRNHYPYDRYSSERRPSSGYNVDDDRYGSASRPNAPFSLDGDRYGSPSSSRPNGYQSANYGYGPSNGPSRPPSDSYNDRPRPGSGNYGITGSIAGADGDSDYPFAEGGPPGGNAASNLQTQKAVALKALAGVALIGAAAALASNPVLLPISVISGRRRRRRRSAELQSDNYALTALLQGYIQPKPNEVSSRSTRNDKPADDPTNKNNSTNIPENAAASQELVITPQCVARLACHVHRDYLEELEKSRLELASAANSTDETAEVAADGDEVEAFRDLEHWFDSLIHSNILVADYLSDELKSLIQSAVAVGSNKNESCDVFSCLNVHDSNKKTT